jgi:Sulfotransferase domain
VNAIAEMAYQAIVAQVFDDRMSERDYATRVFREHIAEVQSEIPAHRLLTFDLREGWPSLCDFLEVEVPDLPFPRTNSSKEFVDEEWKQG